jgi:macrolide-specific efflux system membrane fusion protein
MTERKNRPINLYLYVLAVVAVAIAVLAVAQIGPPTSSARTSTQIVTAENGIVQSTVSGTGNVEAGTDLDVNFQTSGTLAKVDVEAGQHVTKGQLLATLDSGSAQLALDQAEQTLTAAEDQLSSTGSAATIATAQAGVYSAEAGVKSAEAALAATKLYAPISGTIVSVATLAPGGSVSAGTTGSASTSTSTSTTASSGSSTAGGAGTTAGSLGGSSSTSASSTTGSTSPFAEIVNTKTMTMTVAFSESDISKVKVGQAATVTLDALSGVELGAHVTAISPVGITSSSVVSYNATLTLDQTDSQVKPGMSASASVIVGQAQGVTVPVAAVTGTGSIGTVTLVSNGKKTQQQVAVGLRGASRTQIVSGLKAGDELAVTTTLPPLTSATSTTATAGSGTLGGTTVRPGGFAGGGGFGGGAGAGAGAGSRAGAGAGATSAAGTGG